ncbi:MAG: hypothetical protein JST42_26285 [Bacteroidetes bacterium]|nr:hypothetical protein [Bacteroidota bacterium]
MNTDETLIPHVIRLFEEKTGWGDSAAWTNQDFLRLSDLIRENTGVTLSHVTLKRVWGKVKYDSLPNTHTLNTLVQFLGYDSWRDFSVRNTHQSPTPTPKETQSPSPTPPSQQNPTNQQYTNTLQNTTSRQDTPTLQNTTSLQDTTNPQNTTTPQTPSEPTTPPAHPVLLHNRSILKKAWIFIPIFILLPLLLILLRGQQPSPQARDYTFSSKKAVTSGLPNSVVFDYDATRSPDDSVVIQQSWDTTRRVKVSKNDHQHTSVYYYPDFYHATLQVHNHVVKTHNILIGTNGWLPLVEQDPVPVYFRKEEAIHNGKISLSVDQIKQKNIQLQPSPPTVMITNVRDFGDIYTDHFTFETSFRNDYSEGSAACQLSRIYLLCEGTAIWIPVCSKGCISTVDLFFTYYYTTGKREDLSAFGVPGSNDYVKLRIESDSGQAKILINDKLAYTVKRHIIRSKIIGIMYRFQGTGSIDYVSLSGAKASYRDDFN